MPATVTLEENGHVVHIVLKDPVTLEDFETVERQANHWADASPYPLHTFFDARELRHVPAGALRIRQAVGLTKIKSGTTVIVGASMYLQRIAETIFTLTRNTSIRFFGADAAAEALDHLRQIIAREQAVSTPDGD